MSFTFLKPATEVRNQRRFLALIASVGLTMASATAVSARTYIEQDDVGPAVAADDASEIAAPPQRIYSGREGYCEGNLGAAILGGFATQEGSGARRVVEC